MRKDLEHLEEYMKYLAKSIEDLTTRVEMLERELKNKRDSTG